jgi:hypothetical protein
MGALVLRYNVFNKRAIVSELKKKITPVYIPKTYINKYALSKLESYFMNKRADSLTDPRKKSPFLKECEWRQPNEEVGDEFRLASAKIIVITERMFYNITRR